MNVIKNFLTASVLYAVASFAWAGPVNVNAADAQTLAKELNGIGLKKAELIVAYREQFGPFTAVEQLLEVKGVGEKTLEKNASLILLTDEKAAK